VHYKLKTQLVGAANIKGKLLHITNIGKLPMYTLTGTEEPYNCKKSDDKDTINRDREKSRRHY
jgi:hypothetical protein